jgi:hypothetical protein
MVPRKKEKKKKVSVKRKFTDEEFLELYNRKIWLEPPPSDRKMADILGASTTAIALRRYKLRLPPRVKPCKKSDPESNLQKVRRSQKKANRKYYVKSRLPAHSP